MVVSGAEVVRTVARVVHALTQRRIGRLFAQQPRGVLRPDDTVAGLVLQGRRHG